MPVWVIMFRVYRDGDGGWELIDHGLEKVCLTYEKAVEHVDNVRSTNHRKTTGLDIDPIDPDKFYYVCFEEEDGRNVIMTVHKMTAE